LKSLAQALSALSLYPEGHNIRERALDSAFENLTDLLSEDAGPEYSFLADEVIYGNSPLREMRKWEWSSRLAQAGIQRLEFDRSTTREDLEVFLDDALALLGGVGLNTAESRQLRSRGSVGVR
jgi:hypothetical protein